MTVEPRMKDFLATLKRLVDRDQEILDRLAQ